MSVSFITFLALLLLIVITAASFYFYHLAIARDEKNFLKGNPDLDIDETAINTFENMNTWWHRQNIAEWTITSHDGLKLHAYYLPAKQPTDRTAILAHGYSGSGDQMGIFAQVYVEELGFNVLLPDARGHGKSEGNYIGFGWPERKDILRWVGKIIEETGDSVQIVLHGVSMGGATVLMTSGEQLPPNVKAIVEDCGYTSVKDELTYQLKRMYRLPSFPFIQTTSLVTKLRAGYFFGEASALEQVKKSKIPILFIHGSEDSFVPTDMVYKLFETCPTPKKLFVVPGAGHGLAIQTDPSGYDREVSQFIGEYVH